MISRADNTMMQIGTGIFTADITHIRVPVWLTPSNFGFRRANNYVTLVLDVIDPNTLSGVPSYYLKATNVMVAKYFAAWFRIR